MASEERDKRKREEYEMQLFGFHSRAVFATLNCMIHDKIRTVCKKLSQTLENYNLEKGSNLIVDEKNLIECYFNAAKPHIQMIENVVNNFISIPDNVLLEEDKIQEKQYTDEEFTNLHRELETLQERCKRAMKMNALLKEELETLEQFEPCLKKVKEYCNIIQHCSSNFEENNKILEVAKSFQTLREMYPSEEISNKIKYNRISPTVELEPCDENDL